MTRESSSPKIETRESSSPKIVTWGSSSPKIETWESSSPRIETRESSSPKIVTRGSSSPRIETWGSSSPRIETWESSSPKIETRGSSSPRIETWGSSSIKNDVWAVISHTPLEAIGLREALISGLVNGEVYKGDCACLVGTLEKSGNKNTPRRDSGRPAELWFYNIKTGDTPANNPFSRLAVEWIDELLTNWGVEIPAKEVAS